MKSRVLAAMLALATVEAQAATNTVQVGACRNRTDSGLIVTRGDQVAISATGAWQDWNLEPTGPAGNNPASMRWLEPLRRAPDAPWMALMACVEGHCRQASAGPFAAPADGQLIFYVNDVWGFHFNNRGFATAVVTGGHKIAEPPRITCPPVRR